MGGGFTTIAWGISPHQNKSVKLLLAKWFEPFSFHFNGYSFVSTKRLLTQTSTCKRDFVAWTDFTQWYSYNISESKGILILFDTVLANWDFKPVNHTAKTMQIESILLEDPLIVQMLKFAFLSKSILIAVYECFHNVDVCIFSSLF